MNDTTVKNLSDLIEAKFSIKAETQFGDLTLRINKDSIYTTLDTLKSDAAFDFAMLVDVTVIDWVDSKPERFEMVYQLLSLSYKRRLTVRAYVPESKPEVNKISNESPLGRAFLGKKVGDIAEVETPNGKVEFKIISIE